MNRLKLGVVCAAAASVNASLAAQTTIDFESIAHLEFLDDQYLALGIDFNNSMQVLTGVDAVSGTQEALGPPFGPNPTHIDAYGGEFDFFGAWFRGHNAGNVVTIKAFSAADILIGQVSVGTPDSGHSHSYLQIDISHTAGQTFAYTEISINSVGYSMDDLTFNTVPSPGAALVLAPVAGIMLRRRR